MVADSDVGDLLPQIVVLLDLHVDSDEHLMLELAGSASRPVVAGVAYTAWMECYFMLVLCMDYG